ncbi:SGNH/GDSL hydrolase family protein [Nonomuraea muscovyensis]|jgi:lysophospholipase L1-like esterase|uniref:Lysophospholipase L1-like esterase n=1 Tax=Nonomuraea muscovyensis TaxID=1124761 RepID=A0A7X0C7Y2_9ACTN|nr:SGNH/GDSL hydrolase family protein [Nonomuraea muscovyensis]MBB6349125.1 lysophospholipase L1-like esterase [Nonomuraea muscovyensis]MDF2709229.1 hydrolase [Nonomuraea muscovyensis]
MTRHHRSFVALGDSFTEGLNDPGEGDHYRGWADRVAERLAADEPAFRYANLAVRGRLLDQIVTEQVPLAVQMAPDLVSLCAGGNDLLRPGSDPDVMAKTLARAVREVRACGADVLLFTGVDPRDTPLMRRLRGRFAIYYLHIRSIADLYGCHLIDLWSMQPLRDWRAWSDDRLHMNEDGHRLVAARVLDVLGVPFDDWREEWPQRVVDPRARRREDTQWLREHLVPWVARRLRGTSSGDGLDPKRPDLAPWTS